MEIRVWSLNKIYYCTADALIWSLSVICFTTIFVKTVPSCRGFSCGFEQRDIIKDI